jgi:hypothetical protein
MTFEDRLALLSRSLSRAGSIVSDMEEEIRSREELVQRLRREQKLLELSREEVDAVAQTVSGEVRREGRRNLWLNFALGTLFFLLGAGFTLLVS